MQDEPIQDVTNGSLILCIEDEDDLRAILAEELQEAGYAVVCAQDAASGFDLFLRARPNLVLCDVRMPGKDGFDLIARLRRLDAALYGVPFIYLTALADRDNELRGRRLGADDYITKPVDYDILREIVHVRLMGGGSARRPPAQDADRLRLLGEWFAGDGDGAPPACPVAPGRAGPPTAVGEDVLHAALDSISFGLLVVDGGGIVRYVNESAGRALDCPRERLVGGKLVSFCAPLAAFVRHYLHTPASGRPSVCAGHVALGPDGATCVVIARATGSTTAHGEERVTLILPRAAPAAGMFAALLGSLFGLTPAERKLAARIAAGDNLSDFAVSRGIALQTVRVQLRSVFAKVGVTRQADLVRALSSLQLAAGMPER